MGKPEFTFRYKVRNWSEYNRALVSRGRLTLWFDESALASWRDTTRSNELGRPKVYADVAIECALQISLSPQSSGHTGILGVGRDDPLRSAVESEALMWMSMRLAAALDAGGRGDRAEALLSRIGTPVAKYWACKRAPQFVVEALECHGGNGFIEDHLMARLYAISQRTKAG